MWWRGICMPSKSGSSDHGCDIVILLYLYWNDFSLKIFYILCSAEIWVVAVATIAMEYVRIMLPTCICLHCFGIKCLESGSTEERVLMFLKCFIILMDAYNSHKYAADNWWHCSLHCSIWRNCSSDLYRTCGEWIFEERVSVTVTLCSEYLNNSSYCLLFINCWCFVFVNWNCIHAAYEPAQVLVHLICFWWLHLEIDGLYSKA